MPILDGIRYYSSSSDSDSVRSQTLHSLFTPRYKPVGREQEQREPSLTPAVCERRSGTDTHCGFPDARRLYSYTHTCRAAVSRFGKAPRSFFHRTAVSNLGKALSNTRYVATRFTSGLLWEEGGLYSVHSRLTRAAAKKKQPPGCLKPPPGSVESCHNVWAPSPD